MSGHPEDREMVAVVDVDAPVSYDDDPKTLTIDPSPQSPTAHIVSNDHTTDPLGFNKKNDNHTSTASSETTKPTNVASRPSAADWLAAPTMENDENIVFLGDIVWGWIVAVKRWILRNPKTFSCMLTTVMLVLFTKYAQDIVVEVVNLVVRAHPALSPTDELRSKTAQLANELRSMINVAITTGAAYVDRNVDGSNLTSITTTGFLNVPFALETSFGVSLFGVYVAFKMPDSAVHWGTVGCQTASYVELDTAICGYVNRNGTKFAFNNTNTSSMGFKPEIPNAFIENGEYYSVVRTMTAADQPAGVWHAPSWRYDPYLHINKTVMTYSYPLLFDNVTGACIAAASVDVDTNLLSMFVATKLAVNTEVVMVGTGRGRDGLRFVLENLEGSLTDNAVYSGTGTPRARINDLVALMSTYVIPVPGVTDAPSYGIMENVSFVSNGMVYQGLTVIDQWAAIAQGPASDATQEVGEALISLLSEFERSALALRASFRLSTETCLTSVDGNRSSLFLHELSSLLKSFGVQVFASYAVYPINDAKTVYGACGCQQYSRVDYENHTNEANALITNQDCFAVRSDQMVVSFNDTQAAPMGQPSTKVSNFSKGERAAFLAANVPNLAPATLGDTVGSWTAPFAYLDVLSTESTELMSYLLPLQFETDANGTSRCVLAIVVEVSLGIVPRFLSKFTRNGTSEVHLVDMDASTYIGSNSQWFDGALYPYSQTPNSTINLYMQQVIDRAGDNVTLRNTLNRLTLNGAIAPGGAQDHVINFARVYNTPISTVAQESVRTRWGLVEVIPSDIAQQYFYPVPSITSSSQALALLPMDVNLRLFSVVLVLLLVYSTNILVLGCSTVGDDSQPQPAAPPIAPPATSPSPQSTTSAVTPMPRTPAPLLGKSSKI